MNGFDSHSKPNLRASRRYYKRIGSRALETAYGWGIVMVCVYPVTSQQCSTDGVFSSDGKK